MVEGLGFGALNFRLRPMYLHSRLRLYKRKYYDELGKYPPSDLLGLVGKRHCKSCMGSEGLRPLLKLELQLESLFNPELQLSYPRRVQVVLILWLLVPKNPLIISGPLRLTLLNTGGNRALQRSQNEEQQQLHLGQQASKLTIYL